MYLFAAGRFAIRTHLGAAGGVELGPVHRHRDAVAFADHVRQPMDQQGIDVDAPVGQKPVHLLDRVLGQPPAF
jgi:hypothetical protein